MSNQEIATVHVNIMGFEINCPKNKVSDLQEASGYLEKKMLEVSGNNQCSTIDRVAIVAALNVANEVIAQKKTSALTPEADNQEVVKCLVRLQQKLENLNSI